MSWAQNMGTKETVNLQCRSGGPERSSPTMRRLFHQAKTLRISNARLDLGGFNIKNRP